MRDVPKDLGLRIVEAARLAVAMHLAKCARPRPTIGGADRDRQPVSAPGGGAPAESEAE